MSSIPIISDYEWNVLYCAMNSSGHLCQMASANRTFDIILFGTTTQFWKNQTFESSKEYFYVNATYNSSIYLSLEGSLIYNGTSYTGTNIGSGNNLIFNKSIIVPPTTVQSNASFYWSFILNDGSSLFSINTTINNQTIIPLSLVNITGHPSCGTGYFDTINFTFAGAENRTKLTAMNVKYNFEYGTGNSSSKEVYGNLSSVSSFRICINKSISTYKIGYGEIDYQKTGFVERRFYLYQDQALSNTTTTEHILYDLANGFATSFIFEVKNTFLNPYTNKLLALLRWYPELNAYKVVEMAKTDGDGKTVMKAHTEDIDYRVGLYYLNGSLIKLADPVRMACLVNPCSYTMRVVATETDYFSLHDVESSLTFDSVNERFVFIWSDAGQTVNSMRLQVYKDAGYQQVQICNSTATGFTGVLTCSVRNYTGSFYAKAYKTANPEAILASLWHTIHTGVESSFGLFLAFIISLAAGLIGIFSPIGAIGLMIIGLIPAVVFGSIDMYIFMAIVTLGGIVIHFLKKT